MSEEMLTLRDAAERSGLSLRRLSRWCATGKIRCERDADDWLIPGSELGNIARVEQERKTAVEEKRVTALLVPVRASPPNLADQVASRLGLSPGNVSITPLALDGGDYVVAVWRGEAHGSGGLPALRKLADELHADLLDGEVKRERPAD